MLTSSTGSQKVFSKDSQLNLADLQSAKSIYVDSKHPFKVIINLA